MMATTTKTRRVNTVPLIALAASVGIIALGYTLVSAVEAQTNTSTSSSSAGLPTNIQSFGWTVNGPAEFGNHKEEWHGVGGGFNFPQSQVNIAVGQIFTVTSTQGKYFVVGTPSSNGTASGTLTFTVTGKLSSGYILSLSSGSLTVAGTTYTVTSGTALLNRGASGITGSGATTNPTGQFLFRATARGTFVGSTGLVSLDLQSGSSEYLVFLSGSVSG